MNLEAEYILYICVSINEVNKMAIKELNEIDKKLIKMYENQVTTNTSSDFVDKSQVLLSQMNFIAMNNKNFLNLN